VRWRLNMAALSMTMSYDVGAQRETVVLPKHCACELLGHGHGLNSVKIFMPMVYAQQILHIICCASDGCVTPWASSVVHLDILVHL
jgi:hypothetical protein